MGEKAKNGVYVCANECESEWRCFSLLRQYNRICSLLFCSQSLFYSFSIAFFHPPHHRPHRHPVFLIFLLPPSPSSFYSSLCLFIHSLVCFMQPTFILFLHSEHRASRAGITIKSLNVTHRQEWKQKIQLLLPFYEESLWRRKKRFKETVKTGQNRGGLCVLCITRLKGSPASLTWFSCRAGWGFSFSFSFFFGRTFTDKSLFWNENPVRALDFVKSYTTSELHRKREKICWLNYRISSKFRGKFDFDPHVVPPLLPPPTLFSHLHLTKANILWSLLYLLSVNVTNVKQESGQKEEEGDDSIRTDSSNSCDVACADPLNALILRIEESVIDRHPAVCVWSEFLAQHLLLDEFRRE